MQFNEHLLICRNDAIGDVILAFPACGVIKKVYPHCKITLLGRSYTKDAAAICEHIDEFLDYDELAGKNKKELQQLFKQKGINTAILLRVDKHLAWMIKKAGIRNRIGTSHSLYHWRTCNRLVFYSKKKSKIHEAEINLKFLKGIGIKNNIPKQEYIGYLGVTRIPALQKEYRQLLSDEKFNLILHPKSHGHGLEWDLKNFSELIHSLDKNKFKIFISGSKSESKMLASWVIQHTDEVTDISGLLALDQFISFISHADGLIAGSTGPAHIAAAIGIHVLGLYPDIKAKDAVRWGPIGRKSEYLQCQNADMNSITVEMVLEKIMAWVK